MALPYDIIAVASQAAAHGLTAKESRLSLLLMSDGNQPNLLYYGDNLDILRRYIKDETVDLIYLDPLLKNNQDYNIPFKASQSDQTT